MSGVTSGETEQGAGGDCPPPKNVQHVATQLGTF